MEDLPVAEHEDDTVQEQFGGSRKIVDHESDYSKRRFNRTLSPTRADPTGKGGDARDVSTYADRMREAQLDRERDNTMRQIAQKQREEAEKAAADARLAAKEAKDAAVRRLVTGEAPAEGERKRRNRWDAVAEDEGAKRAKMEEATPSGEWEDQPTAAAAAGRGRVWIRPTQPMGCHSGGRGCALGCDAEARAEPMGRDPRGRGRARGRDSGDRRGCCDAAGDGRRGHARSRTAGGHDDPGRALARGGAGGGAGRADDPGAVQRAAMGARGGGA